MLSTLAVAVPPDEPDSFSFWVMLPATAAKCLLDRESGPARCPKGKLHRGKRQFTKSKLFKPVWMERQPSLQTWKVLETNGIVVTV